MTGLNRGDIIQFNENHKWRGALGYVESVKKCGDDYRVMVAATMPDNQVHCTEAYIFSMLSENEFDIVGKAALLPAKEENDS